MTWGPSIRAAATALTTIAVAAVGLVATASVANAEGGLAEKGKATYTVPGDGKPITVTQTMTVTNQSPSTATKYFFWTGYPLWLPNGGTNLRATSNGSPISVKLTTVEGQKYADVSFPKRLQYGQTRTFTVTYTIPGAPPRSLSPGRVGTGFAAIDVFSPGEDGEAAIDIVAPRAMTVDLSEPYSETTKGDNRISTLSGGGSDGLWSLLSLRDSSQTLKKEVKVGNRTFNLAAFPGDTAWVAHITKNLPPTLQELEKLTGQKWPTPTTSISEDFSRQVYGWDGTYKLGSINISEALDPALLAHELAHAWSNYDNLDQRWLTEGLAQELATQVMAATKGKDDDRDTVRPTQKGAFPLAEWTDESDSATTAEDYAYPASWNAVHALVAGSTPAAKPQLFRALTTKRTIYDAPGDGTLAAQGTSWQQAYDLFEVTGGNKQTRSIMTAWVTGPKSATEFTARDATRKTYATNDKLDGDWALPRGVRQAMANWNFAVAKAGLVQTSALSTQAGTAQSAATKAGLDTKGVRAAYEQAGDKTSYDAVAAQLRAFSARAATYGELRSDVDDANPLAVLGGLVLRPGADLERAQSALVKGDTAAAGKALERADSAAGMSTAVGAGLLFGIPALLAALFFGLRGLGRRRARSRAKAQADAHALAHAHAQARAHEAALAGTLAPGLQPGGLVGEVAVGEALEEEPPHDDTEWPRLVDGQPRPGHTA
ncbi:hypothetical protein ACOCJ7_09705 [Knoellia sp. CPCC 206453]|uniref:hypothetical protein n=1 Tax=Knoellia pratensis TaxID=3404796 RepID=UPI003612E2CF